MKCKKSLKGFSLFYVLIALLLLSSVVIYAFTARKQQQDKSHFYSAGNQAAMVLNAIALYGIENAITQQQSQDGISWLSDKSCGNNGANAYLPCDFKLAPKLLQDGIKIVYLPGSAEDNAIFKAMVYFGDFYATDNKKMPSAITAASVYQVLKQRFKTNYMLTINDKNYQVLVDFSPGIVNTMRYLHKSDNQSSIEHSGGFSVELTVTDKIVTPSGQWLRIDGKNQMQGAIQFDLNQAQENRQITNVSAMHFNNDQTAMITNSNPNGKLAITARQLAIENADHSDSVSMDADRLSLNSNEAVSLSSQKSNNQLQLTPDSISLLTDEDINFSTTKTSDLQISASDSIAATTGAVNFHSDSHQLSLKAGNQLNLSGNDALTLAADGDARLQLADRSGSVDFGEHINRVSDIRLSAVGGRSIKEVLKKKHDDNGDIQPPSDYVYIGSQTFSLYGGSWDYIYCPNPIGGSQYICGYSTTIHFSKAIENRLVSCKAAGDVLITSDQDINVASSKSKLFKSRIPVTLPWSDPKDWHKLILSYGSPQLMAQGVYNNFDGTLTIFAKKSCVV
ncbi:MAG: hypothetical protein ACO2ZM_06070 [Francisellaceae bacterium]